MIIEVLYSKNYLSDVGISVFRVYSIVAMFRFTYFGMIPSALGKTKIVFKYSLVGMIINLFLNYLFFKHWGMIGPSIATLVSMIVSASLYFRTSLKLVKMKLFDVFSIKNLIWIVVAMLFATLGVSLVNTFLFHLTNNVFIKLLIEYPLFAFICYAFRYKRIRLVISNMNQLKGKSA